MQYDTNKTESVEDTPIEISSEVFETLRRVLKSLKDFNLDCYKDKCIKRRISIRIRATYCKTAEEYCELLLGSETELELLFKVLTIHVSHFFRNPLTFKKLEKEVIPEIIIQCKNNNRSELRMWSVGCASGEEPYSLAIILKEAFKAQVEGLNLSIQATDVDAGTLQSAKAGIYTEDRLAEVSLPLRAQYFEQNGSKYHLRQEIKEMVSFRQSDIYDIDSYLQSDLILCRNVLIYFERFQQQKILEGFAKALEHGGFLVLGKSETLLDPCGEYFKIICPVNRIYQAI